MSRTSNHIVKLWPMGRAVTARRGALLRDILFEHGAEFPCGGQGRCRGCRVRVIDGAAEVNDAQRERLTAEEIAAGWRLACQCRVERDLSIELRQWDAAILSDESRFAFTPGEGLGVAVDLGTTTVVAQLLDLSNGYVLAVKTALNPQARFGADVMSRVQFAVAEKGQAELEGAIRREIGKLIRILLVAADESAARLRRVTLVGNTVMHHLFCGIDVTPLSHYPFEPVDDGLQTFTSAEIGWTACGEPAISFLPCLGGFVGSDILAGVLATGLLESDDLQAMIDLGTNGEIVVGTREGLLCASTAAGPAFEGARISQGMRAATGAIWRVQAEDGELTCETLGQEPPRGICGSGLVDAVAAGLEIGRIGASGRLAGGAKEMPLAPPVSLTQSDVRQLQLAKGAIAAGLQILVTQWGASVADIRRVYLAGAFGNYVNRSSAQRIGLLDVPLDRVEPVGNAALLGAKIALFDATDAQAYEGVTRRVRHVGLNEDPRFQDLYVEDMRFPESSSLSA